MTNTTSLSHTLEKDDVDQSTVDDLRKQIESRGDLSHASVAEQLTVLEELLSFPFGRYVLQHRGANGLWTDFLVSYPAAANNPMHPPRCRAMCATELFLLERCPVVVAHQERFRTFQSILQKFVKEDAVLASIPCGLMRDILALDYSGIKNYQLLGFDIDPESLMYAASLAAYLDIDKIRLVEGDAWHLDCHDEIDVISSSGLNVYEPDREKVVDLYRSFHRALKSDGVLVCSVLTPPPHCVDDTDWNLELISEADLRLDRIVHIDVLDIRWANFRYLREIEHDFIQAGFKHICVYPDSRKVFPTVVAYKNLPSNRN